MVKMSHDYVYKMWEHEVVGLTKASLESWKYDK